MNTNRPFGGKVVLLGGDWKQLLPVVKGENAISQVDACIQRLPMFNDFKIFKLTQNMRLAQGELEFSKWLQKVGSGTNMLPGTNLVDLPPKMTARSVKEVIDFVFDNGAAFKEPEKIIERLILAPLNCDVDKVNLEILGTMPGEQKEYLSADVALNDNDMPIDIYAADSDICNLNNEIPSGLPPHKLILKVGAVVVLLRNINIARGQCNGTRMVVVALNNEYVVCQILTGGTHKNEIVHMTRQKFTFKDSVIKGSSLHFSRLQFPFRLAFCMTINKAQGQTASKVGILLNKPVFSPGQLYVALSRVRSSDSVRVYAPKGDINGQIRVQNCIAPGLNFF